MLTSLMVHLRAAMPNDPGQIGLLTARARVLLLDDEPDNLHLRSVILRQHGYECAPAKTIEEANSLLDHIDIAVLDYHLGGGQFGTEVATTLRRRRPHIPIIVLSATLDRFFGGMEDVHLLKGHSSVEDLLTALASLEAKRRGVPVVVDARDFFYSRIARSIGSDVLVQIFNDRGIWLFCNDAAAGYLGQPRDWFQGRCIFDDHSLQMRDFRDVLLNVPRTRDTFVDRTRLGLLSAPRSGEEHLVWSVLAFPLTLHDQQTGVVLTARVLDSTDTG